MFDYIDTYESLMNKHDTCIKKAIKYAHKKEWCLATFYKHAAEGYKEKARALKQEVSMSMRVSNGMIHVFNDANVEIACFKSMLMLLQYYNVYRMMEHELEQSRSSSKTTTD